MAAKSETAAPDAFRVVLTKITVPARDDGVLRRLRAESVLVCGKRVTTVFGPAGFGKTLAVAKWAVRELVAEVPEMLLSMDSVQAAALVRSIAETEMSDDLIELLIAAAGG